MLLQDFQPDSFPTVASQFLAIVVKPHEEGVKVFVGDHVVVVGRVVDALRSHGRATGTGRDRRQRIVAPAASVVTVAHAREEEEA